MKSYANKRQSQIGVKSRREQYKRALEQYREDTGSFYRELADTIRQTANGKENAKPASYFTNFLTTDEEERPGIASTIGMCGAIADTDEKMKKYGNHPTSNGIVAKYFPDLRRDVQTVKKYYVEVDKTGVVIGPVKEHSYIQYVYYTV